MSGNIKNQTIKNCEQCSNGSFPDGDLISLRDFIRKYAKDLTEIVRMPNAEYIADAHNEAVRRLRGKAGLK